VAQAQLLGFFMGPVLIIALIIAMGAVVFAVIRGLHAFANLEPENVDENGVPKSLAVQNKAMYSRVKWQAIAVIIVIVLLMIANAK
jgi:H+/gluconate symporter-like permease